MALTKSHGAAWGIASMILMLERLLSSVNHALEGVPAATSSGILAGFRAGDRCGPVYSTCG